MRDLWERAKREPATPPQVGLSVGLGVFAACTPFIGLHMWISLGLATVFRLNRVWAFVGSRMSMSPILMLTTFSEIQVAHHLRTGAWVAMTWRHAFDHGRELMFDWLAGTVLVGGPIAIALGLVAYALARRWHHQVSQRTLDAPPRPSSESPP